jgi:phosphoserine phosphatase RsbU/P
LAAVEDVVRRLLEQAHAIEPATVPDLVAAEAEAAGFDKVELFLVDHTQMHLIALHSGERCSVEGTLAGDAYRRKRAHVVDEDDRSRVWVPLVDGEDRLGVLTTVVHEADVAIVEDTHVLAAAAAGLIVSKQSYTDAYEFVRRIEPMDLAAEFRWALLPPLTMWTPRVCVAGMLEPAYEIAGDAFDYAVNGDIAHVAIFDAVGHGLRACRIANLAVATYRNCRRHGNDISHTAAAIDSVLVDQFGESWFVTALLGELDVSNGTFRLLTAGHPAPELLRGGKVVATLDARPGMPLGLGGATPEVVEVQLEPDDSIFCYSDGVTEARSDTGEFFGEERLSDYLARAAADELLPAETLRRLVHRLYEHRPAPLHDDATMLLVTWRKPPGDDEGR